MTFRPPEPLSSNHQTHHFACGEPILDEWLKRRALTNQTIGATRTFVVSNQENRVLAYYAMAAGAVAHLEATRSIRQNMPDPIPVLVLARLAVDNEAKGLKLGAALLQDTVHRSVLVSQNTGVRAILVHALNKQAQQFYETYGFKASPINPLTLMLRLNTQQAAGRP